MICRSCPRTARTPRGFCSRACSNRMTMQDWKSAQRRAWGREGGKVSGAVRHDRRTEQLYRLPIVEAVNTAYDIGYDAGYRRGMRR